MSVNSKMTAIADAIRGKTGGTNPLTLDQMATAIAEIQTGGGNTAMEDGLVEGTITEYVNNRVTMVGPSAFRDRAVLRNVSMEKCTGVRADAFNGCTNLSSVYFPSLVNINTRGFYKCNGIVEVTPANFPKLENLTQSFNGCEGLKKIVLPLVTTVTNSQQNCTNLEYADYATASKIASSSYAGCTNFVTLVLRNNTVVTLNNISAFAGTPFASDGTGGTVYVPQALIEQYQQATNWSILYAAGTCNFVAIEGSEYE